MDDHSSKVPVASHPLAANPDHLGLKPPRGCPREVPIWHCSWWGLPCRLRCRSRGGLLPHRFTVTLHARPSVLCGAFPGVAPAGRYPAPLLCGVRTFLDPRSSPVPRSSSHPRKCAPKPKWRLRQRGSVARGSRSLRDRCRQAGQSHEGGTAF
ncbi:hypothetical protein SAMN05444003_1250 [Cognatiyoonia sediminum]|uniref:Uncharacterized protein n=1 Tax=Cognatiyoonia sediminum TaxID=1508389 RepID=A0A1M5N8T9_9RHOB|nr:hypothetical protein SAMN05444003_1250 [Cognatiyoonia sediminum]